MSSGKMNGMEFSAFKQRHIGASEQVSFAKLIWQQRTAQRNKKKM